jgi:hypothetical protein
MTQAWKKLISDGISKPLAWHSRSYAHSQLLKQRLTQVHFCGKLKKV